MTLMEVKHKADCEQPLATIDVMNRIAKLFGYGPLRGTTEVPGHCNLFLREIECASPTTSLSRKGRKEGAVWVARAEMYTLRKNYLTTKGIKIGISIEITVLALLKKAGNLRRGKVENRQAFVLEQP